MVVWIPSPIWRFNSLTCSNIHRYNKEIIMCSRILRISRWYIRISSKMATNRIFLIHMNRTMLINRYRMLNSLHNMETNSNNNMETNSNNNIRDLIGINNRCLARVKLIHKLIRINISLMNWKSLEGNYMRRVINDIY